MSKYYAVIVAGVVVGLKQVNGPIDAPDHIEIDSLSAVEVGMLYDNGAFLPGAPVPVLLTRLEFYDRFTDAEMAGIFSAAKTDVSVEVFVEKVKAAQDINLSDPRTVAGVQALETVGLIDAGRAGEILA